jgi:hypothetical protein
MPTDWVRLVNEGWVRSCAFLGVFLRPLWLSGRGSPTIRNISRHAEGIGTGFGQRTAVAGVGSFTGSVTDRKGGLKAPGGMRRPGSAVHGLRRDALRPRFPPRRRTERRLKELSPVCRFVKRRNANRVIGPGKLEKRILAKNLLRSGLHSDYLVRPRIARLFTELKEKASVLSEFLNCCCKSPKAVDSKPARVQPPENVRPI